MVDLDAVIRFEPGLHRGKDAIFVNHRQLARADGRGADEGDSVRGRTVAVTAFVGDQFSDLPGGAVVHDRGGYRERRLHDLLRVVIHGGGDVAAVGGYHRLTAIVAHQEVVLDNEGAFAVIDDLARGAPVTAELVRPVRSDAQTVRRHGFDHESRIGLLTRIARLGTGEVLIRPSIHFTGLKSLPVPTKPA